MLGLNTSPCWQTFGCGTPHEHWQKSGLQGSGPGKRPSEGQVWSSQPLIGCNVDDSDVVVSSGVVVFIVVVGIGVVVVSGALVVFVVVVVSVVVVVVLSVVVVSAVVVVVPVVEVS